MLRQISCAVAAIGVLLSSSPLAQTPSIAPGSKVFLQRMDRAFEDDVTVALIGARVPLVVVNDRKDADFEISGRLRERGDSTYSRDWEATLTVTAIRTAVVVDAFTLTQDSVEKLARACAKRLYEHIAFPQPTALVARPAPPPPAPVGSPPAAPASSGVVRLFVQGDFNRLADFVERLRTELRAGGVIADVVQRGEEYDYNIVFVQANHEAAAIALDRHGVLVASVVDSGFRAKGVTDGCAKKLAVRMAPLTR